ncbi:hypothetical protein Tco_0950009 [Tanacetum coccineum]
MSTHQQSLADVGSEIRPPMLERGSYVPWESDDLKQYEANIEAMNLILISIPNDIYNYVDACQNAKEIWDRVKRLMQGTELSKIEMESRFINEFDKFTSGAGDSLSSVFNRFSQLPNWYKYVTNVCLSKNLAEDPYDALFDYLQQYEGIVNAS